MKKLHYLVLVAILACMYGCNKPGLTVDSVTEKQLFDFDWKFTKGNITNAANTNFNDTNWQTLDLPHDWSVATAPKHNNPMGMPGGFFDAGIGWYRKTFTVPAADKDKKMLIYFEGVYMKAQVYINGQLVGMYPYGYSSFYYDISQYIKYGNENVIAVKVDNAEQNNCRWYSGSGIYRHVWLITKNKLHLNHWGVAITTTNISNNSATVQVTSTITNETNSPQNIWLQTQLIKEKALLTTATSEKLTLNPGEVKNITQNITVVNPILWSTEQPSLYKATVAVVNNDRVIDEQTHKFGIRTIAYNATEGFLLNGKPILLNGGCVHHDNGCLGAAAYNSAEQRKVMLLKNAGFNAVRTSHNTPSEAFLEACDAQGLLVIDEAFDGWREGKTTYDYSNYIDKWWKKDIDAMVKRDSNHPSIIMWSIGNEIIERTKPEAIKTGGMLADYVRLLDNSRPVTSAMTTWGQGWARFDSLFAVHDIGGYNYQLHHAEEDHERVPERVIVQTESYPKDAFFVWDQTQKHPYIIGDFVWTAMDYFGESGIGRYVYPGEPAGQHWEGDLWPWHGAYCGDIDLIGWRKPISHYRSLLWNNDTDVYMAVKEPNPASGSITTTDWGVWPTWESWTWPGNENETLQVEVYSKHPAVRLYLNNTAMADMPTTKDQAYKATFKIPYTAGTLKAVALENGKEVGTAILKTAGVPANIKLTYNQQSIQANGQDLSFITVEVTDANGIVNPNATNNIHFTITGEGSLIGLGNANLQDTSAYVGTEHLLWHGQALAVVKSTKKAGTITLTASSPGLSSATITIHTYQ